MCAVDLMHDIAAAAAHKPKGDGDNNANPPNRTHSIKSHSKPSFIHDITSKVYANTLNSSTGKAAKTTSSQHERITSDC